MVEGISSESDKSMGSEKKILETGKCLGKNCCYDGSVRGGTKWKKKGILRGRKSIGGRKKHFRCDGSSLSQTQVARVRS